MAGPRIFKIRSADPTETSIRIGPELDFGLIHKGVGIAVELTPEDALVLARALADLALERQADVPRAEAAYQALRAREETIDRLRWVTERAGTVGHG